MNSRPLLDYLVFGDDRQQSTGAQPDLIERQAGSLEARIADLEARLRASQQPAPSADLTLSTQIEAILKRKAEAQPAHEAGPRGDSQFRHAAHSSFAEPSHGRRVVVDPPPSIPAGYETAVAEYDFQKFAEAVYLIGQAAKRFVDHPDLRQRNIPAPAAAAPAPSVSEVDALSAVLRETISAFRSVADDLAVSVGEIRHYATRQEREPVRASERREVAPRHRDDDEIIELREDIAGLQHRLDSLLQARRRSRY